ncbi:hypothetical protein GCM10025868_02380 [Angustibacter aerolatus]|uniref:Uncharacterized protein n=1 Tax=Angustibacter aerolatus TaxID=1162965 RepID=A0ABQ6J9Z1_9ACTN|nr:hypothetical protein GCM10025868_02380 [Angustibacter aerolatus]
MAGVGDDVDAGRASAAAGAAAARLARLHLTGALERVEVAADGGGRDPEPARDVGGAQRAVLEDGARDAVAGALLALARPGQRRCRRLDIHHIIVR